MLQRRLILIALAVTAARLLFAGLIHLTEDEAYYRLWAQHLQLGYFDHPPMIAWWTWLGERIAGDTPLGVRLLPALAMGLATWLVGDLALVLGGGARTAVRAAVWYNATFTVALGGMLAIPDAPGSLFWVLTLWCLARAWRDESQAWWMAAGAAAGLSVLSKYSGLFLAPGVLLWLVATPGGWRRLGQPGPWCAALIAASVFAVNIAWNDQNHWVTFTKQFGRIAATTLQPSRLPEFVVTEFLLLNPLIAIYVGAGVALAWRGRRDPAAMRLMLPLATSLPFILYLTAHSLHDRVQGHWPAPVFAALVVCAAAAAELDAEAGRRRLLRLCAPILGFAVTGLAMLHMALPGERSFGTFDPVLALRGWPAFAADVERLRVAQGAAWVGTQSYGLTAQLDAEGRTARVLQLYEPRRYHRPEAERPDFSRPGLVLDLHRRMSRRDLLRCFTTVEPAGRLQRGRPGGHNGGYTLFRVSGPKRDIWTQGCP